MSLKKNFCARRRAKARSGGKFRRPNGEKVSSAGGDKMKFLSGDDNQM